MSIALLKKNILEKFLINLFDLFKNAKVINVNEYIDVTSNALRFRQQRI